MNPVVPLSPSQVDISAPRDGTEWAAARSLLDAYAEWLQYVSGYEDREITRRPVEDLFLLSSRYSTPNGALLVVRLAGNVVGTVAIRRLSGAVAELKQLYLRPSARGLGLATQMLDAALASARRLGVRRLVLEAHESNMPAAIRLYRQYGFYEVPAYGDFSAGIPGVVAMETLL